MSTGVGEAPLVRPRVWPRWLPFAILVVLLIAAAIALLSQSLGGLLHKALTKYAPPDPYQLHVMDSHEAGVIADVESDNDGAAWMVAADFEIGSNSPYGAAWCLEQARKAGASEAAMADIRRDAQESAARWTQIYNALLKNHRYADGNNDYSDIYPLLKQLRGVETGDELIGRTRADLDLLEAHLLLKEGRRTEARPLLAALSQQTWELQGLATYLHAKTWLREADTSTARRLFSEYLQKFPGERLNAYAAYELGNLALQAGDRQGAESWFTEVIEKYGDSPQARVALLAMLDITFGVVPDAAPLVAERPAEESLFDLGASPESGSEASEPKGGVAPAGETPVPDATVPAAAPVAPPATGLDPRLIPGDRAGWDLYGDLFRTAHASLDVQLRAIQLYRMLILPDPQPMKIWDLLTPSSAFGWAEALAAGGVEQGAIRLCDWAIRQPGDGTHRIAAARLRGRLLIGQRKFEEARNGLEAARTLLAGQGDLALLDYEIARTWRLGGNAGRSRGFYQRAAGSPDPELAADALAQAAWAAAQSGNWEAALTDYRSLATRYPTSIYADVAHEHLLSDALRQGVTSAIGTYAQTLRDRAAKGGRHVRGAYYALHGNQSEADWGRFFDRYALTYYGTVVAAQRDLHYSDWSPSAADLTFAALRAQESTIGAAAFRAGLWDIAEAELDAASPSEQQSHWGLLQRALLTASEGVPKFTILSSQEFFDRGGPAGVAPGWTDLLLDASFPQEYLTEIETEATRYNFPPELLLGIIRQESYFNPKAKSTAGARGLMQLMPATGTWAAKQVGLGSVQVSEFEKPEVNLRLGTWHLDFLRRNGATSFGPLLAAHNGGPGNLAKWRERYGGPGVPEWLFLELIPNQESREFVRQVSANQAAYAYLLARDRRTGTF